MACDYYDSGTTATTTTATTTTGDYYSTSTWATTDYQPRVRKVITPIPDTWDDEVIEEYVDLVNEKTNTGWTVDMIIKGDILITDPNIEKRAMDDFKLLLLHRASHIDTEKIRGFFERHPA